MSLCWTLWGAFQYKAELNSIRNDLLSHNLGTEYFEQIVSMIIPGDRLGVYHCNNDNAKKQNFNCLETNV